MNTDIRCGHCDQRLGSFKDFGFLELNGNFHFALNHGRVSKFLRENATLVDMSGRFKDVNCALCEKNIGKKIYERSVNFIALGKERIVCGENRVRKADKWSELIATPDFSHFQRWKISDFSNSRAPQESFPAKDKVVTSASMQLSSSEHASVDRGFAFQSRSANSVPRGARIPQVKSERKDVGPTITDKQDFLKAKMSMWDTSQQVHEFCGPNKKNWDSIVGMDQLSDPTGKLLHLVFKLLSQRDILENCEANPLFSALSTSASVTKIAMYLSMGPLGPTALKSVLLHGRGSSQWLSFADDALSFVEVIRKLMALFVNCRTLLSIELLKVRIDTLVGSQLDREDPFLEDVMPGLKAEDQQRRLNFALHLRDQYTKLEGIQTAAFETVTQREAERASEERDVAEQSRLSKQRARCGVKFLDDESRDADYLDSSIVPQSFELLSSEPSALPKNLVMSLGKSQSDENEDEDNFGAFAGPRSSSVKQSSSVHHSRYQFRSVNHYLNTHFQLNREDCLAQFRRGIVSFREQLKLQNPTSVQLGDEPVDSHADIPVPTATMIRKVAGAMSRSFGNCHVFFYADVRVCQIEKMHDGIGYVVSFDVLGSNRSIDWTRSSRFMKGSLLCLSTDGTFNQGSLLLATVLRGVVMPQGSSKGWQPMVTIGIDSHSVEDFDPLLPFYMVESTVFFEAYRPVLAALQNLGRDAHIPFSDIFLGRTITVGLPEYLVQSSLASGSPVHQRSEYRRGALASATPERPENAGWDMSAVFPDFERMHGTKFWNPLERKRMPSLPCDPALDISQKDAIEHALTKRVAVIQGPPGTGKTFVGVLISKLLLANRHLRAKKPILFICQTNHALDQMLEHVHKFEPNIIRVGGRSESTVMQGLGLTQAKQNARQISNLRLPSRSSDEYQALDRMRRSLVGLRAAFAQRGVAIAADGSRTSFPNSTLARLRQLIYNVIPEASSMIDELISLCGPQEKMSMWTSCARQAQRRADEYKQSVPTWANDFDEWLTFSVERQALLLATYAPASLQTEAGEQIVDTWRRLSPPKEKRRRKPTESTDWQVVGENVGDFSAWEQNPDPAAELESDQGDAIGDWGDGDPDAIHARELDLDDLSEFSFGNDDYEMEDFTTASVRQSRCAADEDLVGSVICRKVQLPSDAVARIRTELHRIVPRPNLLWKLAPSARQSLAEIWANLLNLDAAADVGRYTRDYNRAAAIENRFNARVESAILKSAAVMGMTTNGAAKYNTLLRELQPEIIIAEEAAEVLEASIVASFTPATKHLILIGDHQQLRPQVAEYSIATHNGLEVSLFERFVRLGVSHVTLTTQRRMHPEISALITPSIYKHLLDADTVKLHPPVNGVRDRLFFISHTTPEDGQMHAYGASKDTGKPAGVRPGDMAGVEASKSNSHEAEFLLRLLQYLLLNGYHASRLVVLTMYKGQLNVLRRLVKEALKSGTSTLVMDTLDKVRMTTTDNYQGEESDIVLLSLVRSNEDGKAGFVKIPNRICVALSRARHGMYVIGNFTMFAAASELWSTICESMARRSRIGDSLALQCHVHSDAPVLHASRAEDFDKCPLGGCLKSCGAIMDCGHMCTLVCHPVDHSMIKCMRECTKPRPAGCQHACKKLCWQSCGPCPAQVSKTRSLCGHAVRVACSYDVDSHACSAKCGVMMLCGHSCLDTCHLAGHDKLRYKCPQPCNRTRATCAHACPKPCHEACGDCEVPISKMLECGHSLDLPCCVDVATVTCTANCDKKLPCGHPCSQRCGELCDIQCTTMVKKTISTCNSTPRHWRQVPCHKDVGPAPCPVACREKLACGHICGGSCGTCRNLSSSLPSLGEMQHVQCNKSCTRLLDCNHRCSLSGQHPCGDGSQCPPCSQPCPVACAHGRCNLLCGEPCSPCKQPCQFSCKHFTCESLCYEVHSLKPNRGRSSEDGNPTDISVNTDGNELSAFSHACEHNADESTAGNLCDKPCPKMLRSCGHPCFGVCGELCPRVCAVCDPRSVEICLQKLPREALEEPAKLIELLCGHVFEVHALDKYMAQYAENDSSSSLKRQVPGCPDCHQTAGGTYRYSSLVADCLKRLEPQHLHRQEELLAAEVCADLRSGAAGEVVERLQAMLKLRHETGKHASISPALSLFLGQANMLIGNLREAAVRFEHAVATARSDRIRREALVCLAISHLGGSDDIASLSGARLKNLEDAKIDIQQASAIEPSVIDSCFRRTSGELKDLDENISQIKMAKQQALDAKRATQERQRQEAIAERIRSQQLKDVEESDAAVPPQGSAEPIFAQAPAVNRVVSTGGSALHAAAQRCKVQEVEALLRAGADPFQKDDLGNTALLAAAENDSFPVVEVLMAVPPWHTVNLAGKTFLDIVLKHTGVDDDSRSVVCRVDEKAREALEDGAGTSPSVAWAAAKYFDSAACCPLDELMDMAGIASVKSKALELFQTVKRDMQRLPEARISAKQAMNFIFLGNPGVGKTTVARIFGNILAELGLRQSGSFVETSGQKLLQDGSSKFPPVLQAATPGVLFIDEVYQLDPKGSADGRAITNAIMEATENDRDKLTVIVAGYRDDVREKWISFNPGLSSRFPFEITFEDFSENELRLIFNGIVRSQTWSTERHRPPDAPDLSVDVADVAARRLVRGANKKGFANARSVRILVEESMRRASRRQKQEQLRADTNHTRLPPNHSTTLTLPDVLGSPISPESSPLVIELMKMTGLEDVKSAVMGLLKIASENYKSELRGEGVLDISLHRMFLGNPGTGNTFLRFLYMLISARLLIRSTTREIFDVARVNSFSRVNAGKTTIAGLYGRILKEMGYLSNGEVIVEGASKLIGDVVGSTAKKVNDLIDAVKGKVLVIDEAYVLARANSLYGREALDTLVERVQGTPGEDFAVILCGYEEEMMTMLRDGNPGLSRRFRSEDAFRFTDYDDAQLADILVARAKLGHLYVTPQLAHKAVKAVLAKQRAKPNFGNVGAVNNLLDHAKEKMMRREDRSKVDGRWVLVADDMFETPAEDSALAALSHLVNAEKILEHIYSLQRRLKAQLKRQSDPKVLLKNYVFVGPPGTGKTTVARAFGEVFHGLGLLSSPAVVECKAMELIASYVGQSAGLVKAKMDEARGGVLFIDEAYGLDPSNSSFARDAVEMLLANMTDPKYEGNMVIILAGYPEHITKLLASNPGLHRRVTEQLDFDAWSPLSCLDLLKKLISGNGSLIFPALDDFVKAQFAELAGRPGWGNAADVVTIYNKVCASRDGRCDEDGNVDDAFTQTDITFAFSSMLQQRPAAKSAGGFGGDANLALQPQVGHLEKCAESTAALPPSPVSVLLQSAPQLSAERPMDDSDWDLLEGEEEVDPSDEELWASLDHALSMMGYDVYATRQILRTSNLPPALVALVASQLGRSPARVAPMLIAQCPALLPRTQALIDNIERELERQRQVRKEIQRADAAEKACLLAAERERQREAVFDRVKQLGRCPMNYEWIRTSGGYRCAGGSHFVSDSEVNYVD